MAPTRRRHGEPNLRTSGQPCWPSCSFRRWVLILISTDVRSLIARPDSFTHSFTDSLTHSLAPRATLVRQARERLARIELVKPEKARAIQEMLLGAARQGAIREQVSEERLIELLEQVNERSEKTVTKVTIQRRRMAFDDSDDDSDD